MKYETTKDPNIIKQIETVESEIHIDKLELEIKDLEKHIANCKIVKTSNDYPIAVNQAIEMYRDYLSGKVYLEELLNKKKDLLSILKKL